MVLFGRGGLMDKKMRLFLAALFIAYVALILHETLLSRPPIFSGAYELNLFASYHRAMRAPSHLARIEVRNLILNVAMFVPMGILLPVVFPRLAKFYITLPIALAATIAIETAQFITHRGVFATEDILHNFVGATIGFLLFKGLFPLCSSLFIPDNDDKILPKKQDDVE